ncbi:DNA processing protein [Roseovarius pacificus]|uniref:DNA processing protein n=1 Tax=Roseovarius pacificus TaxID=337701 RepID=A0A1M7KJI8_9RHOB|nr:DNA-processing protein DprA [Roseovarius pacificus]GGO62822.1 hypothetical protein GCM10011315_42720 [Roseovarius pacificus]SHM65288.1 DNA processing protein [Roseovarius pacificus]
MYQRLNAVNKLALSNSNSPALAPISPRRELGAYEALFMQQGATFKRLAEKFASDPSALPSDFVTPQDAEAAAQKVIEKLYAAGVRQFGVRINKAGDYPEKLRDAKYPVELLYYQGAWELSEMRGLAVVGSRKPSEEGARRAARLAKELVNRDFAVVSGLATGIDSAAHNAALEAGGVTIAVIGTPLGEYYPKENRDLQEYIAKEHLLISQIPVLRYEVQPFQQKRHYFPERNVTMSALTEGTIIVEAGETSGTLTQARAALYQGRKLFILENCFNNPAITWPARFEKEGAIRVREPEDIWKALD